MKLVVLAIRDRSADCFGRPTFHTSVGAAVRAFGDEIKRNAEDNVMFRHPEDFDMYRLGEYDDSKGSFECCERPEQVAVGKDYKDKV